MPLCYIERLSGRQLLVFNRGCSILCVVLFVVVVILWGPDRPVGIPEGAAAVPLSIMAVAAAALVGRKAYVDWRCPRCGSLWSMKRTTETPNLEILDAVDGPGEVVGAVAKASAVLHRYYDSYRKQGKNGDWVYEAYVARCKGCLFTVARFRNWRPYRPGPE